MKILEINKISNHSVELMGGKAHSLQIMARAGFPIPTSFFIPANENILNMQEEAISETIKLANSISAKSVYAVRSSAIGEDGVEHSYAGIFESYLNVSYDELPKAVLQVAQSLTSSRSAMYAEERSTSLGKMAVIIQEMIEADYAGVAFSIDPVENDKRIALIEVVVGTGDKLVSGVATPAAIRFNKITQMSRVLRQSNPQIDEDILKGISLKVSEYLMKSEELYNNPIDIEWATSKDGFYMLQARPITTLKEKNS